MPEAHNQDATLIVMDMAPAHSVFVPQPAKSILFSAVLLQINRAITKQMPVIVQDYPDSSVADTLNFTHDFVTDALDKYPYKCFVTKHCNDGSAGIIETCNNLGFSLRRIQLCGLFTNYCIRDSAVGLAKALPESTIEVVRTACASTNPDDENTECFWNRFSEANIVVTPPPEIHPWRAASPGVLPQIAQSHGYVRRNYSEAVSL